MMNKEKIISLSLVGTIGLGSCMPVMAMQASDVPAAENNISNSLEILQSNAAAISVGDKLEVAKQECKKAKEECTRIEYETYEKLEEACKEVNRKRKEVNRKCEEVNRKRKEVNRIVDGKMREKLIEEYNTILFNTYMELCEEYKTTLFNPYMEWHRKYNVIYIEEVKTNNEYDELQSTLDKYDCEEIVRKYDEFKERYRVLGKAYKEAIKEYKEKNERLVEEKACKKAEEAYDELKKACEETYRVDAGELDRRWGIFYKKYAEAIEANNRYNEICEREKGICVDEVDADEVVEADDNQAEE